MVTWEIIYNATSFISEEMGVSLRRSAFSPNIRERADHSCAVLNSEGKITAQAEHIPVHLGSFRIGSQNLLNYIKENGIELNEGDMIISNDPYITGTHLNDVTLLAPVYYKGKIIGYVINKAHNVDVGGPIFGSINPNAKTIYEEGFIIPPVKLISKGNLVQDVFNIITSNSKTPDTMKGDINAQIAANLSGIKRIKELIDKYGLDNVIDGWNKSIEYASILTAKEIEKMPKGTYEANDFLELDKENLIKLNISVKIGEDFISVSFPDVQKQIEYPLNAVFGVTFSAVSFSIKSLMSEDIPVNEGFYSRILVNVDKGTMLNPIPPAPVSGGNLETSDRISDLVFKALSNALPDKIPAASSGTMMNIMLGGKLPDGTSWAYYETIGGGTGGRPGKEGVSGVHVSMTNTLNTPIEEAERVYPMIFTSYRIRYGSGGDGKYKGGDGIVRSFKVKYNSRFAVLADRFIVPPWGLKGGQPGKPGKVTIIRRDGKIETIPSKFATELNPDDEVIIETPGGGGYGNK